MQKLNSTALKAVVVSTLILISSLQIYGAEKPNILFIFADDLSYQAVHSLGNDIIQTPNIDKFSEEGVTFTHTFNMGGWNGAICAASRTMLNTGRSLWRANKLSKQLKDPKVQETMWSKLMSKAGYDTYITGKWHVTAPAKEVYDVAKDIRGGMPNQTKTRYDRIFEPGNKDWTPYDKKFDGFWKGGKHWSEVVGDNAIDFLSASSKSDNPFFMYVAFNAPHDPRQSPKEFVDKYPLNNIPVPESFIAEPEHMEAMGLGNAKKGFLRDEKLAPYPRTEYSVKVNMQEYYAIITHLDQQIGRIIEKLRESGQLENTYIIFSADHGLSVGQHGLIGKQSMYDHSMRPPMMIVGPTIPQNKKIDAMVYLQDLMATTLDLAEIEKPSYVEFNSLIPLIKKEKKQLYDHIYGAYVMHQRAIRTERYKLILYPKDKTVLLFDLKKDPKEMTNLASEKRYSKKVKELFTLLLEEQKSKGDTLDLTEIYSNLI